MTQIQAIKVQNKLAPIKNIKLQFPVKVTLKNGKTIEVADPKATRALVALMDMYAVLGGAASHYGGPAALAELMSALHGLVFEEANEAQMPWYDKAHIINDAGHCENGLYALKANYGMAGLNLDSLKQFRSIQSSLTGHGEVHCFPQGVYLSNGPLGSAFPQSQGLAAAEKLSGSNRITYCVLSDGAAMEGEAKEAMSAIPGLAGKSLLGPYVLIVTDNNTKLSGRIDQDAFSMEPTFESLQTLGWSTLKLEEGNNLDQCILTLQKATQLAKENPNKPVVVWAKTIKGIGTKKTSESSSGGHGFPCKSPTELDAFLKEIYNAEVYPELFKNWIQELINLEKEIKAQSKADTGEKIQVGVSKAMVNCFKKGHPVLSVTSDLPGSTGVAGFRKEFPQACYDVGVAESNMISMAAGLSKQGYIPVVDTFAQFGVTKGALPITMAMLSEAPLIAMFSHTGFQDAADGASHQALSYMSMLATIPYVDLYCLSSSEEAEALVTEVIERFAEDKKAGRKPHTSVFFLGRENFPKTFKNETNQLQYSLTKAQVILNNSVPNKTVLLLTTGSMLGETLLASARLKSEGVGSIVAHQPCINRIDKESLMDLLKLCQNHLVTIEDHQVLLGFGSFITHQMALSGCNLKVKSLGVNGQFGQSAYNAIELYQKHGFDSESIVKTALQFFK